VVNFPTHLADQLTRGFQSANDQFQALQTQVTEGVQSLHSRLQELEAEVAQIQINMRNILYILMAEDQLDLTWCLEDFLSSFGYLSFCHLIS
jgi:uncharacterized phage infection (PIP) family protein YhgE